jgi:hypothetical protein
MMMNKFLIATAGVCLLAANAIAQPASQVPQGGAAASAGSSPRTLNAGATLQAELTKAIDCKKAKSGDEISARLVQDLKSDNGQIVMRKGSKVVGHITEATPKTRENAESRLGLTFEKVVGKDGQELAFNAVIQALAPPPQAAPSSGDDRSGMGSTVGTNPMAGGRSSGGMSPMGSGSAPGPTLSAPTGNIGGANPGYGVGIINASNRGVLGMDGVALNKAGADNPQGSVLSSSNGTIKLDNGTQIILLVAGPAQAK